MLSGFILACTYAAPGGTLRRSQWAFWGARIARIYPIYLVGLGLDLLLFLGRLYHLTGVLASLGTTPLLLQAWIPSPGSWSSWNPPRWSLSVEAFFYLLFPFMLVSLAGRSRRVLWASAGLSINLFAAVPATLIFLLGTWRPAVFWALDQVLYFNPLIRLSEFTLGISLGLLFVGGRRHLRDDSQPAARVTGWDVALVSLVLAAAGVQFLSLPAHYPVSVVVAPIFAAAIFVLASTQGMIRSLLSRRVCVWLGEVSYGIYILHVPIWAWLAWIGHELLHISLTTPVFVPVYLTCVLVAAGLSYRFVERPARMAIRARWAAWEARRTITRRTELAEEVARGVVR